MLESLHRCAALALLARDLSCMAVQKSNPQSAVSMATRQRRRESVAGRLGLLHGLPQKLGQLLAFSDLGAQVPCPGSEGVSTRGFGTLAEEAIPMPLAEFLAGIEAELGVPWTRHFEHVEPKSWAASIGQVHKGRLHGGKEVAIKLQYPGIGRDLEMDLRALGWLTKPWSGLRRGWSIQAFREEIGKSLRRELDFAVEATMLNRFAKCVEGWEEVRIPAVLPELSTPRLLVMEWMDGASIASSSRWTPEVRDQIGAVLVRLFLSGVFQWGLLHADPNPGNYRFWGTPAVGGGQKVPRVGLLDFGCVQEVSAAVGSCWLILMEEARRDVPSEDRVEEALTGLGFQPVVVRKLRGRLGKLARLMSEPFLSGRAWDVKEWDLRARFAALLGGERMEFRAAGPPELIFVLRSFQGLLRYLGLLGARVDWGGLLEEVVGSEPGEVPQLRGMGADDSGGTKQPMKSDALNIQVRKGGELKVSLTFAAEAAEHLNELIPHEMRALLRERDVDVNAMVEKARREQFAPGELFHLKDAEKEVRVWLA